MSPRYISAIIAAIVALGGAVVLANPTYLLSGGSIAQAPAGAPPDAPNRGGPGWLRDLNLNPDQVQKIQAIRSQYKDQLAQRRQAARQAHQELRVLMAGDASTDAVRQKYNQVKTLKQELADAQFDSMLAMREVLTVEQRRQFADRMQHRRGEFKHRMPDRDRTEQKDSEATSFENVVAGYYR